MKTIADVCIDLDSMNIIVEVHIPPLELKKKQQGKMATPTPLPGHASLPGPRSSGSLGRALFRSNTGSSMASPGAGLMGINRSASLTREPKFSGMSRSGRF